MPFCLALRCCTAAILLSVVLAAAPSHAAEGPRAAGPARSEAAAPKAPQTLPARISGFLKTVAERHAEPPDLDAMVFAGLRGVVSRDPAGSVERDGGRLLLRGRPGVSSFDWPAGGDPDALARFAVQVLSQARLGAVEIRRMRPERIEELFLRGALDSLGPRATLLSPRVYQATESPDGRRLAGLGIEFDPEADGIRVTTVFEGSAGDRAGLRTGDLLLAVDGRGLAGVSRDEALVALRAEAGTEARIEVRRGDATTQLAARRLHHEPPVAASLLPNGVAWLRVPRFGLGTGPDFARALERIQQESGAPLGGIILDLRDNPGGYLYAAVGVAAALLPAGAPVATLSGPAWGEGRPVATQAADYLKAGASDYLKAVPAEARTVPLAVLANGRTALAAEVLAAALQENGRGGVVGQRTLGSGSVLEAYPLGNGAGFRIPVARYRTPGGFVLEGVGVSPDLCNARGTAAGDCPSGPPAAVPREAADEDLELALGLLADRPRYEGLVRPRLPGAAGGGPR